MLSRKSILHLFVSMLVPAAGQSGLRNDVVYQLWDSDFAPTLSGQHLVSYCLTQVCHTSL